MAGMMVVRNGITICHDFHTQFDDSFVVADPETITLKDLNVLLQSRIEKVNEKWSGIHGKKICCRKFHAKIYVV